ncbi:hypothetical protein GGR56DRAFT_313612 [Xylariaceae sp. FL0804]|nr:hypothetical protein GGR56DRAFT_313612 [Xylariaceae sp. FL0804]
MSISSSTMPSFAKERGSFKKPRARLRSSDPRSEDLRTDFTPSSSRPSAKLSRSSRRNSRTSARGSHSHSQSRRKSTSNIKTPRSAGRSSRPKQLPQRKGGAAGRDSSDREWAVDHLAGVRHRTDEAAQGVEEQDGTNDALACEYLVHWADRRHKPMWLPTELISAPAVHEFWYARFGGRAVNQLGSESTTATATAAAPAAESEVASSDVGTVALATKAEGGA